jgi:CheY-like chemotaxis protein
MIPVPNEQAEMRELASFDILVVEDDEDTRVMLTECIETLTPYQVRAFESAGEILKRLEGIQQAHPRLFIFDLHLPTLTGLQLYDTLHASKGFEHVPLVIITAVTLSPELQTALAKPNMTLLRKPFNIVELLNRVERLLSGPAQLI